MKRVLPLLAIVLSVFMLIGCGGKEVVDDTPEPVVQEAPIVEEPPVEEEEVAEEAEKKVKEESEEVAEEVLPETVAQPVEDSVWVKYMIEPNDYLTKIALQEYGVVTMWRTIWDWNMDVVGEDPDLIYPFEELSLKKASYEEEPRDIEYVDYTVEKGESLWCIAEKLYGNSYAWIVIMRDNLDVLGNDYNSITPGMVLKIRSDL
ncbi:MAG: LysM peptidoglycan-binding domain-containing protein [Candidatus Marinimicrobia bacterium]|nr:LysM peptidoglycan-binding domain-containing protein [Candidatus Neomarinimicrobiota bacterium]